MTTIATLVERLRTARDRGDRLAIAVLETELRKLGALPPQKEAGR